MSSGTRALGRTAGAVVALLLVSSVLAACQGGGAAEPGGYRTPTVDSVPVVDAGVRLPFREYELSTADRTRMQQGQARLLQRCMAERGFTVTIGGDYLVGTTRSEFLDPLMWGGPFGTMPLEHAERFGYKPEPDGAFAKGLGFYYGSPEHVFLEIHKMGGEPQAERAFYGRGDRPVEDDSAREGCWAEVESAIGAPLVDTIDVESDLSKLTREHPEVESAIGDWLDCMTERGHEVEHVWDASREFLLAPVSRRQIRVAVDDVECTTQSGWANYYYAVLADYERQAIEEDPDLLESALAAERARLAAIERELARAG